MGEGNLQPGKLLTLAESGNVVLPPAVTTVRQSSTAPKFSRFNVTGVPGIITKTKKNGDGNTENAERCEGEFDAQMRVPGQHENNSDRKEKLSSKREDILDNTEPCQTKIRRSQCCCGRTIMVIFRRGKVALLNVITITFSRRYVQITYKLTTFTGVAYGTR